MPKPSPAAAQTAAKLVKRQVPVIKNGKPTGETETKDLAAADVLDFQVYPGQGRIVVVTTDGQKLEGQADAEALAALAGSPEKGDANDGAGK